MPRLRSPLALGGAALLGALALVRGARRLSLRGRCAVVTGGSRGLGLCIARELAGRGCRLVLAARDEGELTRAREELEARGVEVLAVPCDVTSEEDVARLAAAAERRFGEVDVLVNDAGVIQVGPQEALSAADLRDAMAVNYWGTVHATLAFLPAMRRRRRGRIVNVTSIGGTVAVPHLLGYCASKFAAVGFSEGLAAEVAKDGIAVTTIVPGLMRTGSFLRALVKGRREQETTFFSIAASLPVVTIDARRAARRIVLACERGEGLVTVGVPAKVLRLAHALAPNLTAAAMALTARLLPDAGADLPGTAPSPAWMHRRGPARPGSPLTALSDRAAEENAEGPSLH